MFGAAPGWVVDGAVIVGALLTCMTFVGALSRSKPGRWLAREIAKDVRHWIGDVAEETATIALEKHRDERIAEMVEVLDEHLPAQLAPVLYELRANGGGSFRDATVQRLDEVSRRLDRFYVFMDESTMDRADLRRVVGEIQTHLDRVQLWLDDQED